MSPFSWPTFSAIQHRRTFENNQLYCTWIIVIVFYSGIR
uniref:Uncharacterized protein n=1 Tax=Arundo donax TaxID=35708 RepID=A0A0A8YVC3_ARUDO